MFAQAIFTQEQMDRVVEDLKQRTRKFNASTKRFVSDSEWLTIDQVARSTFSRFFHTARCAHPIVSRVSKNRRMFE